MNRALPHLSHMALDIFTNPAMSDKPERSFSSTGIMVRPHISNLEADIIGYMQCLKSWMRHIIGLHSAFQRPEVSIVVDSES